MNKLRQLIQMMHGPGRQRTSDNNHDPDPNNSSSPETVHMGFNSYRRMSRQLIDMGTQSGSFDALDLDLLQQQGPDSHRYSSLGTILKKNSKRSKDGPSPRATKSSSWKSDERIKFQPIEEVKEYVVQPQAYRESTEQQDPFGLDILFHADQLWLEHIPTSQGAAEVGLKAFDFQFNVFDDSEQRILFIRPVRFTSTKPKSFLIFSAIGTDICRLRLKRPTCCTSTLIEVIMESKGVKLSSMSLNGTHFRGYDMKGTNILTIKIRDPAHKSRLRLCAFSHKLTAPLVAPGTAFAAEVYGRSSVKRMGMIRRNLDSIVRGEPYGYYFVSKPETDKSQLGVRLERENLNLHKLHIVAALLVLTLHYNPEHDLISSTSLADNSLQGKNHDGDDHGSSLLDSSSSV